MEIFSRPSCSFQIWTVSILPPHLRVKGLHKGKVLPRCGKKKAQSDSITFFSLSPLMFMHYLFVLLSCFWVSLVLCLVCFFMFLFGCFSIFIYFFHKKFKKNWNFFLKKYKNSVPWMAIKTKFSKLYIFYSLDKHLYVYIHCAYLWCIYDVYVFFTYLTCVVSFLSLYTCFLLSVCNLLFLFHTKMPWWVLFKVFQKYKLSKFTCHKLSSCKIFQKFVLG